MPPFADDQPGPGRAGYFNQYNQGKRSILLDLREAGSGRARPTSSSSTATSSPTTSPPASWTSSASVTRSCARSSPTSSRSRCRATGRPARSGRISATARRRRRCPGSSASRATPAVRPAEIGVSYPDPNAGLMGAYAVMVALLHRDAHRRRPVHRSVAVGGRARAHGRRTARVGHEPAGARAQRQPRSLDVAARDVQGARRRRQVGVDRRRHRGGVAGAVPGDRRSPSSPIDARFAHGRASQAERGRPRRDHHGVDAHARSLGGHRDAAARGRGGVPVDEQQRPRRRPAPDRARLPRASSSIPPSAGASTPASRGRCRERPASCATPPRCPAPTPTRCSHSFSACRRRRSRRCEEQKS